MSKTATTTALLYVSLVGVYLVYQPDTQRSAIVDLWTLAHIGFGVFAAGAVGKTKLFDVGTISRHTASASLILLGWEMYEMCQEMGLTFHAAARFHGGVEHPVDRLLIDPLMGLVGILWYRQMPRVFYPVTLASILWWLTNIYLGRVDGVERIIRSWF